MTETVVKTDAYSLLNALALLWILVFGTLFAMGYFYTTLWRSIFMGLAIVEVALLVKATVRETLAQHRTNKLLEVSTVSLPKHPPLQFTPIQDVLNSLSVKSKKKSSA